jgi:hypothetical protein
VARAIVSGATYEKALNLGSVTLRHTLLLDDFEGTPALVLFELDGGWSQIQVLRFVSDAWSAPETIYRVSVYTFNMERAEQWFTGDFDGDGAPELVSWYVQNETWERLMLFQLDTNPLSGFEQWGNINLNTTYVRQIAAGDVDGTGTADLVFLYQYPSTAQEIKVVRSAGTGFLAEESWLGMPNVFEFNTERARTMIIRDLNGDLFADIITIYSHSPTHERIYCFHSDGQGFIWWQDYGTLRGTSQVVTDCSFDGNPTLFVWPFMFAQTEGSTKALGLPYPTTHMESYPTETGEVELSGFYGGAETAVSVNPANSALVIASAMTANQGQAMFYSDDGGSTWSLAGHLTGAFSGPTVAWSVDGIVAFTATLADCNFDGCAIWFYRSTDNGQSWSAPVVVTEAHADKESIHVDLSPTSPYQGSIYVTWHENNVLRVARSNNNGLTFEYPIAFSSEPLGIGSDITTDAAGNVYHLWPGTETSSVWVSKSIDGGVTFAPAVEIATTADTYVFAIPAMDSRRVLIYVSATCDTSGSPYDGTLYAVWADTTGPEDTTDPFNNHAVVTVAYSRDGGTIWSTTVPHETADSGQVDRFNPWIEVDARGIVHVVYYDTRNSIERYGVDLYHQYSVDGGVTWSSPDRVSSTTSGGLEHWLEWGDHNGLSATPRGIIATWTDYREGNTSYPRAGSAYAGRVGLVLFADGFESGDSSEWSTTIP